MCVSQCPHPARGRAHRARRHSAQYAHTRCFARITRVPAFLTCEGSNSSALFKRLCGHSMCTSAVGASPQPRLLRADGDLSECGRVEALCSVPARLASNVKSLHRNCILCRFLRRTLTDSVSERLRRWTRNPLGSARGSSNLSAVVFFSPLSVGELYFIFAVSSTLPA